MSFDVISSLRCQPEPIRRYFLTILLQIHVHDRVQDECALDVDPLLDEPRSDEFPYKLEHGIQIRMATDN